jgi:diguanylate cyclase (GGDEF)-like protein
VAAYRTRQNAPNASKAWQLMAVAQMAYVLGDLTWGVLEVGFHISPYPSIADIFYLLYYPLFFFAVLQFPARKYYAVDWTKRSLDLITILIGALAVFWNYILGPVIANSEGSSVLEQILGYAYPLGDLALLGALMLIFYNRLQGKNTGPILLITVGVSVMVYTDSIFSVQSILGTYTAGSIVDSGWIIQNLLLWTASIWQIMLVRQYTEEDKISVTLVDLVNNLFSYFPFIWLLFSFGMMYQSFHETLPMNFRQISLITLLLWAIVLIRQIVTNLETKRLFKRIDDTLQTVKKQAYELEASNRSLEMEIAERKKAEERLAFDALHDFLTTLPNRALFIDRLEMAIQRLKRHPDISHSVLFLDLDQFKQINDTKGHSAGDELLVLVAERLRSCTRASDTVARLGGDEFIILLENTDVEISAIFAGDRILDSFKTPFTLGGDNVYISVSIGIVQSLLEYDNSSDVMRDADIAMYRAKEAGKSRCEVFDPSMRTNAIQRVLIENELRYAIEYKELTLYYQPIYSLDSDQIQGFEALLRWFNPRIGQVSPAVFIPVAEETGLIIEIGDWVLNEACEQMQKWHTQKLSSSTLSINVNISGRQFAQPDFVEKLKMVLSKTGLDPNTLKLEITESVLLDSQQTESGLFNSLRDLGIHLQIDDFGTGYSSLSYIQHIPVEVIKIDRSFIQELGNGEKFVELIHAIIRMAHSLGMETTAEGIETLAHKEILKSLGCNYGQGFYLAKPMDCTKAESKLVDEASVVVNPII